MTLLLLPPEILAQIFDEIGSSFFREDVDRLTVCKTWYEFTRPVQFRSLKLTRDSLKSLMSSGFMERSSQLQSTLEDLQLEFRGFRATTPATMFEDPVIWENDLNDNLARFVTRAHECHRLRNLRIRASCYEASGINSAADEYLSQPIMLDLLSLGNLSVLVLDLNAGLWSGQRGVRTRHLCPAISALLPTLQTLHVRMQYVCPDVLKVLHSDECLRLSTVVINTSLNFSRSEVTSMFHSRRCPLGEGSLLQLRSDLQEQAEALANRMTSPKTVRILTHKLPTFVRVSLDVLTGVSMLLDDDSPWDADGEVMEYADQDTDLSDSDFSASSDE
ncbi:hypothetical protein F5Y08DRAFT_331234 [Xylaria arbuscula]|nr:hypothetical protein F5Y08DRAFT_331234 [Xylaria arbuscula]